jgi:Zn-dependent peptidase ImmA (M78 family)
MGGNYVYQRLSSPQICAIAAHYLAKYSLLKCGKNGTDIEAIQEELGFEVIFRRSLGLDGLKGYVAHDPRYIVVSELTSARDARYTIAHELSHKILEFDLWKNGAIPDGAQPHELTSEQYRDIEENAWELAAELMEPAVRFREVFIGYRATAAAAGLKNTSAIFSAARDTAEDFEVILRASARRARGLEIITKDEHQKAFPVVM